MNDATHNPTDAVDDTSQTAIFMAQQFAFATLETLTHEADMMEAELKDKHAKIREGIVRLVKGNMEALRDHRPWIATLSWIVECVRTDSFDKRVSNVHLRGIVDTLREALEPTP